MDSHPPSSPPGLDPSAGVSRASIPPWPAPGPSRQEDPTSGEVDGVALRTVALADRLLREAHAERTARERRDGELLGRLMDDANGKAFTLAFVDQVFRSSDPSRRARRWREILAAHGAPGFVSWLDRALVRASAAASRVSAATVMPMVEDRARADSARVILDGAPEALERYLRQRRGEGFRVNLNHLGEAVLGEAEANRRLEAILTHLANPEVTCISVKLSALFSQINLLAWESTLSEIQARLRRLLRAAQPEHKLVNLDMEEYRDLALTLAAFRGVLDEPEFASLTAGIALQAYLPDSWTALVDLTSWARARVARGGAPIRVRLVKGANLAQEMVEAELHGWNVAAYATKRETDANYRRMLAFACRPENAAAVYVGVATHNLFDVALALVLRAHHHVESRVQLEMLEGMANHQARAARNAAGELLLYAPAVAEDDFLGALAYLVRRLEENTAPQNFLRDLFSLEVGSEAWQRQTEAFIDGWTARDSVSSASRRSAAKVDPDACARFVNQPDTDWTQAPARDAVRRAVDAWRPMTLPELPSLDALLDTARAAQPKWWDLGAPGRAALLRLAARRMHAERFAAIACMRDEGKKAVPEADSEVSEAVDFARYYATTFHVSEGAIAEPLGVVVVAPPWNFPYAIPAGGVFAALMAGNAVVLKPAPEAVQTAALLARQLWDAGIPRDVLQLYPCADGATGRALISDPRVSAVVLTGSWETARRFQNWRPSLRLFAETSGKNAIVVTAQADRDLAVKDLVRSAFGHAGQKCSAASLGILEAEVYDDPAFRRQLRDAAASLAVGPASDPRSVITPVIRQPSLALERALTTLDDDEEWLLAPERVTGEACLWSPGIKLGVQPGSWFHQTECFGPVLGLMRADSLEQAIAWQNAVDYGLTAGLQSLDPAEIAVWCERVEAGNLYVNRPITGAVVRRQPFGGWKRSSIGPGAKAGGPNYVMSFCTLRDRESIPPQSLEHAYRTAYAEHFAIEHDPSRLRAERNAFRYRPARGVIVRLEHHDSETERRARLASELTGTPLTLSVATDEPDVAFAARLEALATDADRVRTVDVPSDLVLRAIHGAGLDWICAPLSASGRRELCFWLREQCVSRTLHRYGQLPEAPLKAAKAESSSSREHA